MELLSFVFFLEHARELRIIILRRINEWVFVFFFQEVKVMH